MLSFDSEKSSPGAIPRAADIGVMPATASTARRDTWPLIEPALARIGPTNRFYVELGDYIYRHTACGAAPEPSRGSRLPALQVDLADPGPLDGEDVLRILEESSAPRDPDAVCIGETFNGFHVLRTLLSSYKPRLIVTAYNAALGKEKDLVVPYLRKASCDGTGYQGASFSAVCALASHFGYTPVDGDAGGNRLLLVRDDCASGFPLPAVDALFSPPPHSNPPDPHGRPYLTSAHYLMDAVTTCRTAYGYISFFLNDEYIGGSMSRGYYWQQHLVEDIGSLAVGMHGLALDIGAHVGTHAIAIAQQAPGLMLLCFEPQVHLWRLLERNILENNLGDRVTARCCAVGHAHLRTFLSGTVSDGASAGQAIEYGSGKPVNFGGVQLGSNGQICELIRIDDLDLQSVRYIKVDAEGAEPLVFSGMQQTLEANLPLVVFEDRNDRALPDEVSAALLAGPEDLAPVSARLRALGYRIEELAGDCIAISPARARAGVPPIPARIFQTWKSRDSVPPRLAAWSSTFRAHNPAFTYTLWDDRDNRDFIQREFPWFLNLYDRYPAEIYRADAVRYFHLYMYGGLYADMDTECLRPLDGLLNLAGVVLGRMGQNTSFAHSVPNASMASRPRQEFWLFLIALMMLRARLNAGPEFLTGPILLKNAVDLYLARRPVPTSSSTKIWHIFLNVKGASEAALFEWEEIDGRIEGFYSGILGQRLPVTGLHDGKGISIAFQGTWPSSGVPVQVGITGALARGAGSGACLMERADRVVEGIWSALDARLADSTVGCIRRKLTVHQQPEPFATDIGILESSEFYAIDWANPDHQHLRLTALNGQPWDRSRKTALFPNAWMVNYWAHTWEQRPGGN
jgi:FkbM family methyltransferase